MKGSSRPGSAPAFSSGSLRSNSLVGGAQAAPFLMQKGFTNGRPVQSMSQMYPMSQSQPTGGERLLPAWPWVLPACCCRLSARSSAQEHVAMLPSSQALRDDDVC
jgi:hypothetical protein